MHHHPITKIVYSLILCLISTLAIGQVSVSVSERAGPRLDTNKVVYDEQGKPLRYYQYSKLLNSGEYTLKSDGDPFRPETKNFLKKLTLDEQVSMMQMSKKFMKINNPILEEGAILDISPLTDVFSKDTLYRKVIILIFWNTQCPPCTESFESFNNFLKQIRSNDAMVIAVTSDNKPDALAKLKEKPLLYANVVSDGQSVIDAYNIRSFPSFIITDRSQIVRLAIAGQGPQTIPLIQSTLRNQLQGLIR